MKEKKFFIPEIFPPDRDIRKKWFVYYYEPLPGTNKGRRIRMYGGINRASTVQDRMDIATKICESIVRNKGRLKVEKEIIIGPVSILLETIENNKQYLRPKTYTTYSGQARKFIEFLGKKKDFEVNKSDAIRFVQHLFELKLRPKTINSYQTNLKTLYNKYIDLHEYENFKNPFLKLPRIKNESRSLQFFNDYQISALKEFLVNKYPEIWLGCQLQYYCFIRPNELRQLKAENFNLSIGFIEIPGSFSKNKKTQKVSIPTSFQKDLNFISGMNPDQLIFPGKSNKPISRNIFTQKHKKALQACNIRGNYAFYSWKHTGVVKAVKAGIHIKDLQLQLRHHSLDMVNEYLKNLGVLDMDRIKDLFPAI